MPMTSEVSVNAIQSNAGGPAGMVNMLAALDKKQAADRQIATAESRANKELAGEEKRMKFAAMLKPTLSLVWRLACLHLRLHASRSETGVKKSSGH